MTNNKLNVRLKQMVRLLNSTRFSVSLEGGNPAWWPSSCCFCPSHSKQPFTQAETFCGIFKLSYVLVLISHLSLWESLVQPEASQLLVKWKSCLNGQSLLDLTRFPWVMIFDWFILSLDKKFLNTWRNEVAVHNVQWDLVSLMRQYVLCLPAFSLMKHLQQGRVIQ